MESPAGATTTPAARRLTVKIIATTREGTRAALQSVRRLTFGLSSTIVVLVPIARKGAEADMRASHHPRIVESWLPALVFMPPFSPACAAAKMISRPPS